MSEDLQYNQEHDASLHVSEELERLGLHDARTNVPVNIFYPKADPPLSRISPAALDALEPGHYTVEGSLGAAESNTLDNGGFGDTFGDHDDSIFKYALDIEDRNGDKVVSRYAFGDYESYQIEPVSHPILQRLGFHFEDNQTFVPTPETVKRRAAELDVDVELLPETTLIDPERYLRSYSEGRYPVATASEEYYQHDISDDHITGVVYGGPVLRQELMNVLRPLFDSEGHPQLSQETLGELAFHLDNFTVTLRNYVMDLQKPTPDYDSGFDASDTKRLITDGARINLNEQQVHNIMQAAKERSHLLTV
jgi:hypothetical protein